MNKLNLLVTIYSNLHNYKGIPFWVLTPFRRIVRTISKHQLPKYLRNCKKTTPKDKSEVIVSFTSFPARIENVWQVVECMLRQTYQPKKIFLWLSKEQFPSKEELPKSLLECENDIFEIRFVDGDIRSHKKYYYVSKEYPDSLILLIDDDIYYPTDMVEKMIKEHYKYPKAIISRYGSIIKYNKDGSIAPRKKGWNEITSATSNKNYFFGSGGGTLIIPNSLYRDLTNKDLFLNLTPTADDIWLNSMARLNNIPIRKIKFGNILPIKQKRNNPTLASVNLGNSEDDIQIQKVINHYKNTINVILFQKQ